MLSVQIRFRKQTDTETQQQPQNKQERKIETNQTNKRNPKTLKASKLTIHAETIKSKGLEKYKLNENWIISV